MIRVSYVPLTPEELKPEPKATQWSLGIAMFAAFVIPFVLLFASARYRVFVAQARHQFETVTQAFAPAEAERPAEAIQNPSPVATHD